MCADGSASEDQSAGIYVPGSMRIDFDDISRENFDGDFLF